MRRLTAVGLGVALLIGLTGVVGAAPASGGPADAGPSALGPLADDPTSDPCWEDITECTGTGPTNPNPIEDEDNDGLVET